MAHEFPNANLVGVDIALPTLYVPEHCLCTTNLMARNTAFSHAPAIANL